jgi:hypothetical protein
MVPHVPPGVSEALLTAVRVLPVLLIVALSTPAWIAWPFLPEPRQRVVVEVIKELAAWARGTNSA